MAVFFYFFAFMVVISGFFVITSRNPVHGVLWLILAFCNASGLMLIIGAEFLAMMLIIIYVGAVAVLFLFVVMMLDIKVSELKGKIGLKTLTGGAIALLLFADLTMVVWAGISKTREYHTEALRSHPGSGSHPELVSGSQAATVLLPHEIPDQVRDDYHFRDDRKNQSLSNPKSIGAHLYTDFILPFQSAGLILFTAMVASIALTMRQRPGVRRQNRAMQLQKNKENSLLFAQNTGKLGLNNLHYDD